MSSLSEFEEMYLKRIFEAHSDNPGEIVRTTKLADSNGSKPGINY